MWKRDAQQEYMDGHIPGAVRFDIAVVADRESKLPLTLPSAEQYAKQVGEVGVANSGCEKVADCGLNEVCVCVCVCVCVVAVLVSEI